MNGIQGDINEFDGIEECNNDEENEENIKRDDHIDFVEHQDINTKELSEFEKLQLFLKKEQREKEPKSKRKYIKKSQKIRYKAFKKDK